MTKRHGPRARLITGHGWLSFGFGTGRERLNVPAARRQLQEARDRRERQEAGKKMYVCNLARDVTERALSDLFRAYGTVKKVEIILDRVTGRSRGFGFVVMGDEKQVVDAIIALDGQNLEGHRLTVERARPRQF